MTTSAASEDGFPSAAGVGRVLREGKPRGAVVLVAPRFCVTAAIHLRPARVGSEVTVKFGSRTVSAVVVGWWPWSQANRTVDLALLSLAEGVGVPPVPLDVQEEVDLFDVPLALYDPGTGLVPCRLTAVEVDGVSVEGWPGGAGKERLARFDDLIETESAADAPRTASSAPVVRLDTGAVIGISLAGTTDPPRLDFSMTMANVVRALAESDIPGLPVPPAGLEAAAGEAPGYDADVADGVDRLGLARDINALATLVAARTVTPPLSIGLFGDWGSGKSFFMRAMRRRIDRLAELAAAADANTEPGEPRSVYCGGIRQISFNAWHYAETNLWASLATHIFDSLAAPVATTGAGHAAGLPEERGLEDQLQARQVERRLLGARMSALEAEEAEVARSRAGSFLTVAGDALASQDLALLGDRAGLDDPSVEQLRSTADELRATGNEIAATWRELLTGRERPWVPRLAAAGLAILLVGAIAAIALAAPGFLVAAAAGLLGVMTAVGAAAQPVLKVTRAAARMVERLDQRQDAALAPVRARRSAVEAQVRQLDADIDQLRRQISDIRSGSDISRYLEERGASSDYRRHLGIVALARRDFEVLTELLARERSSATTSRLERVVLYVDDLDRCPPETVVKVLEAVHLLLTLPLFVVVVAVDPRWLVRAVEQHYSSMLAMADEAGTRGGERARASALDYLEKIFQIPYSLPPMRESGFARLIESAMRASGASPAVSAVSTGGEPTADGEGPIANADDLQHPSAVREGESDAGIDLHARTLHISDREMGLLRQLSPLVRMPRSAKRLANVYRLARIQVPRRDIGEFVGSGYQPGRCAPTMVLLAVLVGFPEQADRFLRRLRDAEPAEQLPDLLRAIASPEGEEWPGAGRLATALGSLLARDREWPTELAVYQVEIPRVSRFSFHTATTAVGG